MPLESVVDLPCFPLASSGLGLVELQVVCFLLFTAFSFSLTCSFSVSETKCLLHSTAVLICCLTHSAGGVPSYSDHDADAGSGLQTWADLRADPHLHGAAAGFRHGCVLHVSQQGAEAGQYSANAPCQALSAPAGWLPLLAPL